MLQPSACEYLLTHFSVTEKWTSSPALIVFGMGQLIPSSVFSCFHVHRYFIRPPLLVTSLPRSFLEAEMFCYVNNTSDTLEECSDDVTDVLSHSSLN